jgi:copper chaperone CopZ
MRGHVAQNRTVILLQMVVKPRKVAATKKNNHLKISDMKKLLFTTMIALIALTSQAQFSKAVLQATGLTCAMCSNAINKALEEVPFISSVKADIKNSSFNIKFKENTTINIDALKTAVEDAGFSIGSLKVTGNFDNLQVANDTHVKIGEEQFHFLNVQSRVLSGENTITIVDKNFLTAKQFKKFSVATKMDCVQTGKAASCCIKEGVPAETRIYHVTI